MASDNEYNDHEAVYDNNDSVVFDCRNVSSMLHSSSNRINNTFSYNRKDFSVENELKEHDFYRELSDLQSTLSDYDENFSTISTSDILYKNYTKYTDYTIIDEELDYAIRTFVKICNKYNYDITYNKVKNNYIGLLFNYLNKNGTFYMHMYNYAVKPESNNNFKK